MNSLYIINNIRLCIVFLFFIIPSEKEYYCRENVYIFCKGYEAGS